MYSRGYSHNETSNIHNTSDYPNFALCLTAVVIRIAHYVYNMTKFQFIDESVQNQNIYIVNDKQNKRPILLRVGLLFSLIKR